MIFITNIDFQVAGIEELSRGVVCFFDRAREGATVDVDVQNREEDADATKLSQAEAGVLCLIHADHFPVRWADKGEGIVGGSAVRITKEEKKTNENKSAQQSSEEPAHPKGEAKKNCGTDKERSCFA